MLWALLTPGSQLAAAQGLSEPEAQRPGRGSQPWLPSYLPSWGGNLASWGLVMVEPLPTGVLHAMTAARDGSLWATMGPSFCPHPYYLSNARMMWMSGCRSTGLSVSCSSLPSPVGL